MEPRFLFPHRFKLIGWIIIIPSIILGVFLYNPDFFSELFDINYTEKTGFDLDELALIGIILGLTFIGFSKVKIEDEFVSKLRLESLQWAIYVNYALLILATIFIYDLIHCKLNWYKFLSSLSFSCGRRKRGKRMRAFGEILQKSPFKPHPSVPSPTMGREGLDNKLL